MLDEVSAEGIQFRVGVCWAFGKVAPNRLRPTGVVRSAANDVEMQLWHQIAKGAEVHLGILTFRFEVSGNGVAIGEGLVELHLR